MEPSIVPASGGPGPTALTEWTQGYTDHVVAPKGALGQRLLAQGLLTLPDLQFVLTWQRCLTPAWQVRRLGSLIVKAGLLPTRQVITVLSQRHRVPVLPPGYQLPRQVPPALSSFFPPQLLQRLGAVPLYLDQTKRTLVVGLMDPMQAPLLQELTRYRVQPVVLLQFQAHRILRSH